jgi:hypothetical protein
MRVMILGSMMLNNASTVVLRGVTFSEGTSIAVSSGQLDLSSSSIQLDTFLSLLDSIKASAGTSSVTLNMLMVMSSSTVQNGKISVGGNGRLTSTGLQKFFYVHSGPCVTTRGGRCVGRNYTRSWPYRDGPSFPIVERCEITVLGGGSLGESALFDTVSYGPTQGTVWARHDAVGVHGANCAPDGCDGTALHEACTNCCYVSSYCNVPDPAPPNGCYAGSSGPPSGTLLVADEVVTWAATAESRSGYHYTSDGHCYLGDAASAFLSCRLGWEICFE